MNAFEEHLADWALADAWRPVVERLAERVATWPAGAPAPEDFCVDAPVDVLWHQGVLVWAWTGADGTVCLGGQFDAAGLRCGALNPHNPGDHLETWFALDGDGAAPAALTALADAFLDWLAREAAVSGSTPPSPARDSPSSPGSSPGRSSGTVVRNREASGPVGD